MKLVINETQYRNILTTEKYVNEIFNNINEDETPKDQDENIKSTIKTIVDDLQLGTKFVFTFGTGIGALIGPVMRLFNNEGFSVSEYEVTLLVISAISIIVVDSNDDINKLTTKLKEEKLIHLLDETIQYVTNVKNLVNVIAKKTGHAVSTLFDFLGYTFLLVPTTNIILDIVSSKGLTFDGMIDLLVGLTAATSSYLMKSKTKN